MDTEVWCKVTVDSNASSQLIMWFDSLNGTLLAYKQWLFNYGVYTLVKKWNLTCNPHLDSKRQHMTRFRISSTQKISRNCRTNQDKKRVESAHRGGHAHEKAPEDHKHGRGAQARQRQEPPRRAALPLPQRGEDEARRAHAGPGHGRPVPIDKGGDPLPAAPRRHVRPGHDVHHRFLNAPNPPWDWEPTKSLIELVNLGAAKPAFLPIDAARNQRNRNPGLGKNQFPPNQSNSTSNRDGWGTATSSRTHQELLPASPGPETAPGAVDRASRRHRNRNAPKRRRPLAQETTRKSARKTGLQWKVRRRQLGGLDGSFRRWIGGWRAVK